LNSLSTHINYENILKRMGVLILEMKNEINIRSSAAEYLTYIASVGEQKDSIEIRSL